MAASCSTRLGTLHSPPATSAKSAGTSIGLTSVKRSTLILLGSRTQLGSFCLRSEHRTIGCLTPSSGSSLSVEATRLLTPLRQLAPRTVLPCLYVAFPLPHRL